MLKMPWPSSCRIINRRLYKSRMVLIQISTILRYQRTPILEDFSWMMSMESSKKPTMVLKKGLNRSSKSSRVVSIEQERTVRFQIWMMWSLKNGARMSTKTFGLIFIIFVKQATIKKLLTQRSQWWTWGTLLRELEEIISLKVPIAIATSQQKRLRRKSKLNQKRSSKLSLRETNPFAKVFSRGMMTAKSKSRTSKLPCLKISQLRRLPSRRFSLLSHLWNCPRLLREGIRHQFLRGSPS